MFNGLIKFWGFSPARSVGLCFLLFSIQFSFWITRIPEIKNKLSLSDFELGNALFFIPLGAIVSMLMAHHTVKKYGEGKATMLALVFYACMMSLPMLSHSYLSLCSILLAVGLSMGWLDITMNTLADRIEKTDKVKIMSMSHGFFSLGGIIGGIIGGLLAEMKINGSGQLLAFSAMIIIAMIIFIKPHIQVYRKSYHENQQQVLAWPHRSLWILAGIAFCIMLGEGAVADWSTVFMEDTIKTGPAMAGLGYAAFSATMTIGRFNGDQLHIQYGTNKLVIIGLATAAFGLLLLFSKHIISSVFGFALFGLGYSSLIPLIFSKAASKKDIPPSMGIASVATLGYFGFLLGPVFIGYIAEWAGLTMGFGLIIILTLLALVLYLVEMNKST